MRSRLLVGLLACASAAATAGPAGASAWSWAAPAATAPEPIEVFYRNNRGWFKPVTLIYYPPGDERGEVESRLLLPWQRFRMSLPTGTRVYVASPEQVERWRGGASLRHLPPAMTIRPSDAGELYNLFR